MKTKKLYTNLEALKKGIQQAIQCYQSYEELTKHEEHIDAVYQLRLSVELIFRAVITGADRPLPPNATLKTLQRLAGEVYEPFTYRFSAKKQHLKGAFIKFIKDPEILNEQEITYLKNQIDILINVVKGQYLKALPISHQLTPNGEEILKNLSGATLVAIKEAISHYLHTLTNYITEEIKGTDIRYIMIIKGFENCLSLKDKERVKFFNNMILSKYRPQFSKKDIVKHLYFIAEQTSDSVSQVHLILIIDRLLQESEKIQIKRFK